jgi:hypothetical protein
VLVPDEDRSEFDNENEDEYDPLDPATKIT